MAKDTGGKKCGKCNGTGVCETCKGTGRDKGHICGMCLGNGVCVWCNGKRILYPQDVQYGPG